QRKWVSVFTLAAILGLVSAAQVQAGMIPAAVNIAGDGSNFRFTYNVILPSDYTLKDGDYFTIYDFKGLVPGSNQQPAGWSLGTSMTGLTPVHLAPTDDPSIPNLTFTYHGSNIVGPFNLGKFAADSTFGGQDSGDFTSRDHGTADGRSVNSITSTTV